jgi:hypothetical protein
MTIERAVDQDTLYRMREIIRVRLTVEGHTVEVASAEARGFGTARHPNARAEVDAAINEILTEMGALEPPFPSLSDKDGVQLTPAAWATLTESLSYALRFDERGKRRSTGSEHMAAIAAGELTRRLEAGGFVLMRRPIRSLENNPQYVVPGVERGQARRRMDQD